MPLILIAIGVTLIIYNYHFIKKENNLVSKEKIPGDDLSFRNILQENKDDLNDYKMEIGILRKDIAESLTELQEEILDIKNSLDMGNNHIDNDNIINKNISNESINNPYISNDNINSDESYNQENEGMSENKVFINSHINDDGVISEINFSDKIHNVQNNKTQSIKDLLEKGLIDDEICHKLSVSKGEVLLVKSLFKK